MNLQKNERDYRKTVQLVLLLCAGAVLFPFVFLDSFHSGLGYFVADRYLTVPCLLFFGTALGQQLTPSAKRNLLMPVVSVLWFAAVQMQHQLSGMGTSGFGVFAVVYLLAFPYAAVTEDGEKKTGLNWISWIYVAFSSLLVVFTLMLLLDAVPQGLKPFVYWDGVRTRMFWHPNGCGGILMTGIGLSMYLFTQTSRKPMKWFLAVLTVLQYGAIILTNSRTSIFITCALIGAGVFFMIWKGSWKQFAAGVLAAVVTVAALMVLYDGLFDLHKETQFSKLMEAAAAAEAETVPAAEEAVSGPEQTTEPTVDAQRLHINESTGEVSIRGSGYSAQGDLSTDMKSLNGRTYIWQAAFRTLQDNPALKIWGTEYVAAEISYRNHFQTVNSHNSWIQMMMMQGIPGLLLALVYTVIAVWNIWILLWRPEEDFGKKMIALLMVCVMGAGFLECYLFVGEMPTSFANFIFFLGIGYLIQWNRKASKK